MFQARASYHHLQSRHIAHTLCAPSLPPLFHGHPGLAPTLPSSHEGPSTLPSFWTVGHLFVLALMALMALIKALRNAPDSRHSHLCRRHHLTLLPSSRHLFVLTTSLPCPLFLPDS